MTLTQERLKQILKYDPKTGIFIWSIDTSKRSKKGTVAGSKHKANGCWQIGFNKKVYKAHRLAFLFMEGYVPENEIDHIDRNPLNNKWDNLREASRTCNTRNRNVFKNNASGLTGVYFNKNSNKWYSQIKIKKLFHLGTFNNIIDAVKARWNAEVQHNFPNCNSTSSAYLYLKEHNLI